MTNELRQRLLSLDPKKPFVWRLKLTEDEYRQLKEEVQDTPHAPSKEQAVLAVVYIAEWYKREYDGNVQNPLAGITAETLWDASGIDKRYLYSGRKNARNLESLYMFGGMPMYFLLKRTDKKVLQALCTLYKDKNAVLADNLHIGKGLASAFQNSIHQMGSLYHLMKTLLQGNESDVYAKEDLADKSSLTSQFVEAIKKAYDNVMRDKFRLEWIVEHDAASPYMRRMARLWLNPEELGGLHQYLRFERANTWKIPELMRQRHLRISLVFRKGLETVGDDNTRREIITFENSGQEDTGFEATGMMPWGILRSIPTQDFDKVCAIVTTDDGKQYEVQTLQKSQAEYMQLWAMPDEINRWSSIRNDQRETAVIFTDHYKMDGEESVCKPFYDKSNGLSKTWRFATIADHVTLHHPGETDITLWNRDGYIQFCPVLYTSVLRYKAGKVRYLYNEDPEIYPEPETEEWYPAVFRREDIRALHFASRDTENVMPDEQSIEKIEYKPFDAPNTQEYEQWTEYAPVPYGRLKLRLTIKGDEKVYPILFLPSLLRHGEKVPVVRDFEQHVIKYEDAEGKIVTEKVDLPMDKQPLDATHLITVWGNDQEQVQLDVIQPTLIKEVYLDGHIIRYINDGEKIVLPYLLRNRITIHDFNRQGYSEYECFNVGVLDEMKGSIQKWKQGETIKTKNIAATIPSYIRLAYGLPENEGNVDKMLYWKYSDDKQPEVVDANYDDMAPMSVLFQDMRLVNDNLDCVPPKQNNELDDSDWDWDDWGYDSNSQSDENSNDILLLKCFDVATTYKTYYFIFNPLFNLNADDFVKGICIPLKNRNNDSLSEEDLQNLMRCATECGLNWEKLSNKI